MHLSVNFKARSIYITALIAFFTVSVQSFAAPQKVVQQRTKPNFGPNVLIIDSIMPREDIEAKIDKIYTTQKANQFGFERNAIFFMPGEYSINVPVGFYTEIRGVGATPDAVHITGNVYSDAYLPKFNATCNFWRGVENFSITPVDSMQWAVSQAVPFRRMHILGDLKLHDHRGWASGGWISDSLIDGNVDSGSQQQWVSRNSEWKSWTGSNWNMVFVGINHPPAGQWPDPPYTTINRTPVVREKPFLQVDARGAWSVRVPALQTDSTGITWHSGATPGHTIPLSRFYIAHPGKDTSLTLNAQLARGMNLLFTPGVYELTAPIRVTRPNTVVMGLGFATLKATRGNTAITTADADGIILAGLLIDAGEKESLVLVEIGREGSHLRHVANPISLHDVFFREGGSAVGRADVNLRVNANDTIIDHTWIWRADHGNGVGWDKNTSKTGLVVNGDNVTAYGLFVEHHQNYQVVWNGNHGRTYFYQSELPYDAPTQASYSTKPGVNGWASYKVADTVTSHEAWGLGIYSVFRHPDVKLDRAIEAPNNPDVRFHSMITVALDNLGEISNVINDKGGPTATSPRVTPKVIVYP